LHAGIDANFFYRKPLLGRRTMAFASWVPWLKVSRSHGSGTQRGTYRRSIATRKRFVPRLDILEDRTVLSTFLVTTAADEVNPNDDVLSLREAIAQANTDASNGQSDTIRFASSLGRAAITLDPTLGQLELTGANPLARETIDGGGRITVSGGDKVRVFYVSPNTTATIAGLTITLGHAETLETVLRSHGGGILNDTGADLTLTHVILCHNTAQGILNVNDEPRHLGGGAGGGVANKGTLDVNGCTFLDNQALGVDYQNPIDPTLRFPGIGIGGGLWNWQTGTATVTDSRFIDNLAQAGSHCTGTFAGLGQGGAIYNDNDLGVTGTLFSGNRAIGGDHTTSPAWSGPAVGGAISSGTNERLIGSTESAELVVSQCIFKDNEAHGGNESVASAVPQGVVPGAGTAGGGAIFVFQGEATVSQSVLDHNQAFGGAGGALGQFGGLAFGGGICFINFLDRPTAPGEAPGVKGTVDGCALVGNQAIGGTGGTGARGGNAQGGGIAAGTFGLNLLSGSVEVSNTLVADNLAQGGNSGSGGNAGNGLGGGVFNGLGETLTASHIALLFNEAEGGDGGAGANGGNGLGGGLYNAGNATVTESIIAFNEAEGGAAGSGGAAGTGNGGGIFNVGSLSVDALTVIFGNLPNNVAL
jgi:CSLREA domain-containing protein